jgi:hypothetical protein
VPIEYREPPGHHQGVEAEGGHQVLTTLKQMIASNMQKNLLQLLSYINIYAVQFIVVKCHTNCKWTVAGTI